MCIPCAFGTYLIVVDVHRLLYIPSIIVMDVHRLLCIPSIIVVDAHRLLCIPSIIVMDVHRLFIVHSIWPVPMRLGGSSVRADVLHT